MYALLIIMAIVQSDRNYQEEDNFYAIYQAQRKLLETHSEKNYKNRKCLSFPFIWPINQKKIKSIIFNNPNVVIIKTKTNNQKVINIADGTIETIDFKTETILIKHVLEEGVIVYSKLKGVSFDKKLRKGLFIKQSYYLGVTANNDLMMSITRQTNKKQPRIDEFFPILENVKYKRKIDV